MLLVYRGAIWNREQERRMATGLLAVNFPLNRPFEELARCCRHTPGAQRRLACGVFGYNGARSRPDSRWFARHPLPDGREEGPDSIEQGDG